MMMKMMSWHPEGFHLAFHLAVLLVATLVVSMVEPSSASASSSSNVDPKTTLECHRREYTFRAQKFDSLGRRCWDYVKVMSCWGRCESLEIADWKFPYKMSHHPVCIHSQRSLHQTKLSQCDPEVEPGTEVYEYYEADSCACHVCQSADYFCEGLLYLSRSQQRR